MPPEKLRPGCRHRPPPRPGQTVRTKGRVMAWTVGALPVHLMANRSDAQLLAPNARSLASTVLWSRGRGDAGGTAGLALQSPEGRQKAGLLEALFAPQPAAHQSCEGQKIQAKRPVARGVAQQGPPALARLRDPGPVRWPPRPSSWGQQAAPAPRPRRQWLKVTMESCFEAAGFALADQAPRAPPPPAAFDRKRSCRDLDASGTSLNERKSCRRPCMDPVFAVFEKLKR